MNRSRSLTAANSATKVLVASSIRLIRSSIFISLSPPERVPSLRPSHEFRRAFRTLPVAITKTARARTSGGFSRIISQRKTGATLFQAAMRIVIAAVRDLNSTRSPDGKTDNWWEALPDRRPPADARRAGNGGIQAGPQGQNRRSSYRRNRPGKRTHGTLEPDRGASDLLGWQIKTDSTNQRIRSG